MTKRNELLTYTTWINLTYADRKKTDKKGIYGGIEHIRNSRKMQIIAWWQQISCCPGLEG